MGGINIGGKWGAKIELQKALQWGLEYQTHSKLEWQGSVLFSNGVLFSDGWQNGKNVFLFSNGPNHWKTDILASLEHFKYKENLLCV